MESLLNTQKLMTQHRFHSFVSYFAREIIHSTNKIRANGYIVIEEYPIRDHIITDRQKRANVAIVEILKDQNIILIVGCKTHVRDLIQGRYQLYGYMVDLECKIGIVMTVDKAEIYLTNQNGIIENTETINLAIQEGIDRMIEIVNSI
jgi:hypothetical protein